MMKNDEDNEDDDEDKDEGDDIEKTNNHWECIFIEELNVLYFYTRNHVS